MSYNWNYDAPTPEQETLANELANELGISIIDEAQFYELIQTTEEPVAFSVARNKADAPEKPTGPSVEDNSEPTLF